MKKIYLSLMTSLLLCSSAALADPYLSVSFESSDSGSQARAVVDASGTPAPSSFSVVIKNTSQYTVAIGNVSFSENGGDATNVQATAPATLSMCNNTALAPGASCKITPLTYALPAGTPAPSNDTLTVSAISTVPLPKNTPTTNTLNLSPGTGPNGSSGDLTMTLYNVSGDQEDYQTYTGMNDVLAPGVPLLNQQYYVLQFAIADPNRPAASYAYTIKNVSATAKTVVTRCVGDGAFSAVNMVNQSQCDNISLASGGTCQSALTMMPSTGTNYSHLNLAVFDASSPAVPAGSVILSGMFSPFGYGAANGHK